MRAHLDKQKKNGGLFLLPVPPPPGEPAWQRRYDLFQNDATGHNRNTGTFREFAEVQPTEEGIQAFANKYGWLGTPQDIPLKELPDFPVEPASLSLSANVFLSGENIELWRAEINHMHDLVALWEAAKDLEEAEAGPERQEKSRVYLRERVIWSRDKDKVEAVTVTAADEIKLIAAQGYYQDRFEQMEPGDLVMPAKEFLRQKLAEKLKDWKVTGELAWIQSDKRKQVRGKQQASLALRLFLWPENLIGALWLQFAIAIDGARTYLTCAQCGHWFEEGAERNAGAKFCEDRCKQKDKRRRMKEAFELHKRGLSMSEIARRVGSDIKTVKVWAKAKRNKGGK